MGERVCVRERDGKKEREEGRGERGRESEKE